MTFIKAVASNQEAVTMMVLEVRSQELLLHSIRLG